MKLEYFISRKWVPKGSLVNTELSWFGDDVLRILVAMATRVNDLHALFIIMYTLLMCLSRELHQITSFYFMAVYN